MNSHFQGDGHSETGIPVSSGLHCGPCLGTGQGQTSPLTGGHRATFAVEEKFEKPGGGPLEGSSEGQDQQKVHKGVIKNQTEEGKQLKLHHSCEEGNIQKGSLHQEECKGVKDGNIQQGVTPLKQRQGGEQKEQIAQQQGERPKEEITQQQLQRPEEQNQQEGNLQQQETRQQLLDINTERAVAGRWLVRTKQIFKDNKFIVMVSTGLGATFGWILGTVTTYWLLGWHPQNIQNEVHQLRLIVEQLQSQREPAAAIPVPFDTSAHNISEVCLRQREHDWKLFEDELKREHEDSLKKLNSSFRQTVNATATDLKMLMEIKEKNMSDLLYGEVQKVERKTTEKFQQETDDLASRQKDVDQRLILLPQVMEIQGFMTIEKLGPVLLLIAGFEMLLALCVGILCRHQALRSRQNSPASVSNGNTVPQKLPHRINTHNSNVAVLSFREAIAERCVLWGRQLLGDCRRPLTIHGHVVNCLDDVDTIPACCAALVFVEPDEREMIVEDARHHIGQGLRRQAIQRLMDSDVEVFVIIFNDKNSTDLNAEQLYNRSLGQIKEHAQLRKLQGVNRVLSIKDTFQQNQKIHVVRELNRICV